MFLVADFNPWPKVMTEPVCVAMPIKGMDNNNIMNGITPCISESISMTRGGRWPVTISVATGWG